MAHSSSCNKWKDRDEKTESQNISEYFQSYENKHLTIFIDFFLNHIFLYK